eukprot:gene11561-7967_t
MLLLSNFFRHSAEEEHDAAEFSSAGIRKISKIVLNACTRCIHSVCGRNIPLLFNIIIITMIDVKCRFLSSCTGPTLHSTGSFIFVFIYVYFFCCCCPLSFILFPAVYMRVPLWESVCLALSPLFGDADILIKIFS